MKQLKIKTIKSITKNDLLEMENFQFIPDKYHILNKNLKQIINYNRLLFNGKSTKEEISEKLKKFKIDFPITSENKSQINKHLSSLNNKYFFDTNNIRNISINSKFQIEKEIKLSLSYVYKEFYKDHLNNILSKADNIKHIKIYDFYKDEKEVKYILENIENKLINTYIQKFIDKKPKIEILTHLYIKESFDFYQKLYKKDNNISIKYIPESASRNIYIPSLFFMLIRYKVKNTRNYKNVVLYLEPSTNWGVISDTHSIGFTSQFTELLNIRFDEQFKNNEKLIFKSNELQQTTDDFYSDIENILAKIDVELSENTIKINENILEDIHQLKTNYKTIDYSYKLLKSFFYNILYLNTIKNHTKNNLLTNTNIIVKLLIEKEYSHKIEKLLIEITKNNSAEQIIKYSVDIKKLRRGIIEEINGIKAICDIFPNMRWMDKDNIIDNLSNIATNKDYLNRLYEELNLYAKKTMSQKKEAFEKILVPNLIRGQTITFNP